MKILRKIICLVLAASLSTYTLPVLAASSIQDNEIRKTELTDEQMLHFVGAGNVDATMSEYVKFDPTLPPVAEAVVSNRSLISVPYLLEVMDINGVALEELASGTLAPGETKVISGTATVQDKNSVRVTVGGAFGLQSIDTAWLITKSQ